MKRQALSSHARRGSVLFKLLRFGVAFAGVYLIGAYLLLPMGWGHFEKRHPALDDAPRISYTRSRIPADPLNLAFVGTVEELHRAMLAAHWYPADPITLRSSIRIAGDSVFHRSYDDAPVSNLYVWGRSQNPAFEQPQGNDPRKRHHVRFWRAVQLDQHGRPLWMGAATFDTSVGLSHTTGQITHHISPDVDAERDKLIDDVRQAGYLADMYWVDDFQEKREGKNGGGDPYHTDGRLAVGVLAPPAEAPSLRREQDDRETDRDSRPLP